MMNNRKLFLVGLEAGESQDHQQVPRLVRPVSWFLDCLLLLPVLAAWEPIPSRPDPSQSACLLGSSPHVGWSLRAHKPSAHCSPEVYPALFQSFEIIWAFLRAQYIFFLLYVPWALENNMYQWECNTSYIRFVTHVIQILEAMLSKSRSRWNYL